MGKLTPAQHCALSKSRGSAPSLPKLKCLDAQVDAADVKAGKVVEGTFRELVDALEENHWRNRLFKEPRPQRVRRAKPKPEPVEPVDLLVQAETLERPAPPVGAYSPEAPTIAPRNRFVRLPPPSRRRIPKSAKLVTLDIADPDYAGAAAQVIEPPPGSTANGHGPHEWQTPARRTVHVVARADVVGLMFARGQLDQACFHGARTYQQIFETAELAGMPSASLDMPSIRTRCMGGDFARVDSRRRAAAKLRQVEAELDAAFGSTGVQLVRDILGRGQTIEAAAKDRGDTRRIAVKWWGGFFRRCLGSIAVTLGFALPAQAGPSQGGPRGG